jgi:GTPase SAR1 family protein
MADESESRIDLSSMADEISQIEHHDITLDSVPLDGLNNPTAETLLNTIDSLRELQLRGIVHLPQIIVVGDQSTGKSSVLEAISGFTFPTKGDVCTRFATELVLRRAQEIKINVRIESSGISLGTSPQFSRTVFNQDTLPEIIGEATERMGIRPGSTKEFSKDVLRVEITAPNVPSLTLVDLPGFFHSRTDDQTLEGRDIARHLAEHYMRQPRSIILAVVSANSNLAKQIVVEDARRYDPGRERTLGVITKPDLAGPNDEKKFIQLTRGDESTNKLKLGWHVLRNRAEGKEHITNRERNLDEEAFFQSGPWSAIPANSRGFRALREKLSELLLGHIRKTLPCLVKEIEANLSTRQRSLEKLGKPRSETDDLRSYLLEIADKFQRLARDGVEGRYSDDFFGGLYDNCETRRLRALLRNLNRAFYATLLKKGVDRKIEWEEGERSALYNTGPDWIRNDDDPPSYLRSFLSLFDDCPQPITVDELTLCGELDVLAANNLGTEFPGLPNGNLGFQLFKMQMRPWGSIADCYLDHVVDFAKSFVKELLQHIIDVDEQTFNAIMVSYVEPFFWKRRSVLQTKLEEILRPYNCTYGPPLDAEFHATLISNTAGRDAANIAGLLEERFPAAFTEKGGKGLSREQVERVFSLERNRASELGNEKVIDMAMTHFQVLNTKFPLWHWMSLWTATNTNPYLIRCRSEHLPKMSLI